ncbi:MAG: protein phosphatase 2C domain-containing protein [Eubacteriales bacterium]|nr:protein phosphatase 2C domain-containing protein [Eubacteriales bacterium]
MEIKGRRVEVTGMQKKDKTKFLKLLGPVLQIYSEKVVGKGEDAFASAVNEQAAMIGCFDGCGGIGSRRYSAFDTHTGAYVASRVTAEAALDWFLRCSETGDISSFSEYELAEEIVTALKSCKDMETSGSALKGSLTKDFPTTLSMAVTDAQQFLFLWAGDSRGYILDENGLHQMTKDDVDQTDAMRNLSDDGPLKNVVNASKRFEIHKQEICIRKACVVITCTDGCFGYLASPMSFELLLLDTLKAAESPKAWEALLKSEFAKVAGDDFTWMAIPIGFEDFVQVKKSFALRHDYMKSMHQKIQHREAMLEWWESYRKEYETF